METPEAYSPALRDDLARELAAASPDELAALRAYYAHRGGPGAALVAAEAERRALLTDRPVTATPVQ